MKIAFPAHQSLTFLQQEMSWLNLRCSECTGNVKCPWPVWQCLHAPCHAHVPFFRKCHNFVLVKTCLAAASMHACITSLCSEELCLKSCTHTHGHTHAHSHGQYMHTYTRPFVHDQLELKRTLCDVFLKVYRQIRFHVCAHAPHAVFDRQKPYWQSEGWKLGFCFVYKSSHIIILVDHKPLAGYVRIL